MPFTVRKWKTRYWVVDPSGKKYSKKSLTRKKARAQQKALYASSYLSRKRKQ
jgi:hypothetical protein